MSLHSECPLLMFMYAAFGYALRIAFGKQNGLEQSKTKYLFSPNKQRSFEPFMSFGSCFRTLAVSFLPVNIERTTKWSMQMEVNTRCPRKLAMWTCKVLCGSFLYAIYKFSFIHSFGSCHIFCFFRPSVASIFGCPLRLIAFPSLSSVSKIFPLR